MARCISSELHHLRREHRCDARQLKDGAKRAAQMRQRDLAQIHRHHDLHERWCIIAEMRIQQLLRAQARAT
eukprot:6196249-Pleurochrysis_carterae.AAC.1